MKKISVFLSILMISIFSINIYASNIYISNESEKNMTFYIEESDNIFSKSSDIEYITQEKFEQNKEEMKDILKEYNSRFGVNAKNKNSESYDESFDMEAEMKRLGYTKMTDEQKRNYVNICVEQYAQDNKIDDNGIVYPDIPGIDMYISYHTQYNSNKQLKNLAEVFIIPSNDSADSRLVRNYEPVEMLNGKTLKELISETIEVTVSGLVSSTLTTGQSLPLTALLNAAEPYIPNSNYTNSAILSLTVSSVSNISHIWSIENGRYSFKLATNSASIRESWVFVDNRGNHSYTYNEMELESYGYRSLSIASNLAQGSSTSYNIPDYHYKTKGFLGIYYSKLKVSPYYAGSPMALANK